MDDQGLSNAYPKFVTHQIGAIRNFCLPEPCIAQVLFKIHVLVIRTEVAGELAEQVLIGTLYSDIALGEMDYKGVLVQWLTDD